MPPRYSVRVLVRFLSPVLGLGLVLVVGCSSGEPSPASCRDCNVVLISIDTLRADHVAALGYPRATTPHFDALAARGVLYENAIAQSSWTRPAHMSMFTGLHPREHGFVSLGDTRPLEDTIPTIASVLRKQGYRTAAFVGGVNLSASIGFDRGFDVFRSNGKYFRDNLEDSRYWLDHEAGEKFFLFLHGYDAHTPYANDRIDRAALGIADAPPQASHAGTCREEGSIERIAPFLDEYDAAVHRADRYLGKIVADLQARNLLRNTILLVVSDHGEEFLEHGRCFHISTLYREVLHVPVLIVAPGLASRRVAELVAASVSIAPTVMELLGISPHPFPGPSLWNVAEGRPSAAKFVVSETERSMEKRGDGHLLAVTTADTKLIRWTTKDQQACFDLRTDLGEHNPLPTCQEPADLTRELDTWTSTHTAKTASRRRASPTAGQAASPSPSPADAEPDEEALEDLEQLDEELRSLGYAQ